MVKRAAAAYLWIMACWSLGAVLERSMGVSEYLGLLIGIVVAVAIVVMPARLWTRRIGRASTVGVSVEPRSTRGLTAAD
jgi:membrane associated rhomboid family serine protease